MEEIKNMYYSELKNMITNKIIDYFYNKRGTKGSEIIWQIIHHQLAPEENMSMINSEETLTEYEKIYKENM